MSSGKPAYSRHASCYPVGVPAFDLLPMTRPMYFVQGPKEVVMILTSFSDVRRIFLDVPHSKDLKPSWHGESVGHYEGDTLVVDTVGIKSMRPLATVDIYGRPYTDSLHVVERYRPVDYEAALEAEQRTKKENISIPNNDSGLIVDQNYRGKALQLEFVVEDEGVFTMAWSASMTYLRASGEWPEFVCSENTREYYAGKDSDVPRSDRPDFWGDRDQVESTDGPLRSLREHLPRARGRKRSIAARRPSQASILRRLVCSRSSTTPAQLQQTHRSGSTRWCSVTCVRGGGSVPVLPVG